MLTWNKALLPIIMPCFVLAMIAGCGGSSSVDSIVAESVYTGVESQALIDENNAQQILVDAYLSGSSSSSLRVPFAAADSVSLERINFSLRSYLTTFAKDLVQHVNAYDGAGAPSALSAVKQKPVDITDEGEGSISGTVNLDDETGDFWGTLTYSNYSLSGVVSNGVITFEGNTSSTGMTTYIDFNSFTVSYGDVSQTMDGRVSISESGDIFVLVLNIVSTDNSTGKTYWMKNYRIEVEDNGDYEKVSVSGLFYDYDYGYVVLSTRQPLAYLYNNDYPSNGIIEATGAKGSAGDNTWAILIIQSPSTYFFYVDTDGDGYEDWKSGIVYW